MCAGGPAGSKYLPKKKHVMGVKKGWRAGHGGRLAYNINMMVRACWVCRCCRCCLFLPPPPPPCIGQFGEAGLCESMPFAIFCAGSCKGSLSFVQEVTKGCGCHLRGQFLSRRWFTLCVTMEVEPRTAKQYKCQCCCSCENYRGKGMEGGKKVSLRRFGADQKIASS